MGSSPPGSYANGQDQYQPTGHAVTGHLPVAVARGSSYTVIVAGHRGPVTLDRR